MPETATTTYPEFLNETQAAKPTSFVVAQAQVHEWQRKYTNLDYWPPMVQVAKLAEETGEISREMMRRHGPKKKDDYNPENLKLELCDTMYALFCIANTHGINLDEAWKTKLDKDTQRDANRWK